MPQVRRWWVALVFAVAFSSVAAAVQKPSTPSSKNKSEPGATTAAGAMALLTALAHDSMQGRMAGSPGAAKAAAMIAREMGRIGLKPVGDSAYYQQVPGKKGVNIIGVLPGTDKSLGNEHVVISAHYDNFGMEQPIDGDSIFNGADDDASGVVGVLEVARQMLAGPAPRRTIVFAVFTDEEGGGTGVAWYMAHPFLSIDSMASALHLEMIGRPDSAAGGAGKAWLTGYGRSTMGSTFTAAGLPIVPDPYMEPSGAGGYFYRSGNVGFTRRGVVAHMLSSYNLNEEYHTRADDISHINGAHLAAVINAAAKAVRLLADGETLKWNPGGDPRN